MVSQDVRNPVDFPISLSYDEGSETRFDLNQTELVVPDQQVPLGFRGDFTLLIGTTPFLI